jgi:hypothetical protein
MEKISVEKIQKILIGRGEKLKPASKDKIDGIEKDYQVVLPAEYKKFLTLMGNGAGNFMLGSSVFLNELVDLRSGTIELCEENNIPIIPNNAFVFWMHQGYQAAYFNIGESDDPPVYYFSEGKGWKDFMLMESSFSAFLWKQLILSYPDLDADR